MSQAEQMFQETLLELKDEYDSFRFYLERDIVWTIQRRLVEKTEERNLPYHVYHHYPFLYQERRIHADLVILSKEGGVVLAAEFKYEPAHNRRNDFMPELLKKFPVTAWAEIIKDAERAKNFVITGQAIAAYAVLIDEGGFYRQRQAWPNSFWENWGDRKPSILISRYFAPS